MEVINLDSVNLSLDSDSSPTIRLSDNDNDNVGVKPSSMTGIELLMNTKKTSEKKVEDSIDLGDLQSLEKELNDLSGNTQNQSVSGGININKMDNDREPIKLNVEEPSISTHKLGGEPEKTWDGFQQFNNIPMDPDKTIKQTPEISREQMMKDKFTYLRKLEALEKKGIRLSKQYTMESSLQEMIGEYETIKSEKERGNSVKFQGRMLMAAVTGLEF